MKAERIFEGTNAGGVWNKAIFKVKEGNYYYISENSTIEVTDHEYLNVEVLEEIQQGGDHNLFAVKGDERDMLQQLEMDRFNFEDVEWGIESSTLCKGINDFPKGSIRAIGTTYAVTRFGMRCVFGSIKK
ncbi:hypothetical protein G5716_29880 [Bacillus pacificus]|nr:hypothetical protein [Bacillus pacificus]